MLKKLVMSVFCLLNFFSISHSEVWRFGIMGDTQWKQNLDGENPNTVAAGIAKMINKEMIKHKVAFVIQVGDLCDTYSEAALNTRASIAQELIDSGIGFFPLRGNHESSQAAANYFCTVFPQTRGLSNTFGATNFSSPSANLEGLTYSFDFKNARLVLLDQFRRKDGSGSTNSNILDQIPWIKSVISTRPENFHAFVLSRKNLIGQNHIDVLLGANPASNFSYQDSFFIATAKYGVKYHFSGHDHMHHRSIVLNPSRQLSLHQVIASSNSYKFYTPLIPALDIQYNNPPRETPIVQELYTIGYYIVTVDGEWVTVDHYSSPNGCGKCDLTVTPSISSFEWRESFGYSLNGKEFIIAENGSFTIIKDTSKVNGGYGTKMEIISGVNNYAQTLLDGRKTSKVINTGWKKKEELTNSDSICSDILRLWGIENGIGTDIGDVYVLSMSYSNDIKGALAIMLRNSNGEWIKPASMDVSNSKFIIGQWKSSYGLGFYGIDPATKTVWVVLKRGGILALKKTKDGDLDGDGDIDDSDVDIVLSYRNQPADVFPAADFDNDGKITIIDARKLVLLKTN
ncbi:MAG: metallophosphoesterase [Chitinispirillaceae bacterium]|nr:metallophosphoesterase [Chitinispirillaceae bacterium]